MKLKHLLIGVLLFFLSINLFSQVDSTAFYDLKLVANKVQIWEKRENKGDKVRTHRIVDSYFFFTETGIYGADAFGMMKYEFLSPLKTAEGFEITKYFIDAKDIDTKKNCSIVVYHYYKKNMYKMFVKYKHNQYIFNCVDVE